MDGIIADIIAVIIAFMLFSGSPDLWDKAEAVIDHYYEEIQQ